MTPRILLNSPKIGCSVLGYSWSAVGRGRSVWIHLSLLLLHGVAHRSDGGGQGRLDHRRQHPRPQELVPKGPLRADVALERGGVRVLMRMLWI